MLDGRRAAFHTAAIAAAVAIGVILRLHGLFTDFWLDEIWGLQIARDAGSAIDLITRIHTDTNHPLMLMWMRLIGPQVNWEWYRLPSLVAGIAMIVLLIRAAHAKIVMAILASLSVPLVVYSSEARGYALAACLLVAAFVLRRRETAAADVAFGVAIVLALLSHIGAVTVYAGFLAADAVRFDLRRHVLPALGVIALYFVKVRHLVIVGSPRSSAFDAAVRAAGGVIGANAESTWVIAPAFALAAVVVFEVFVRARARDADAIFYAVAVVVAPAAAAAATAHRCACVAPRYFFFSAPFLLLLLATFMARLSRPVVGILMTAFVVANAVTIAPFIRYGRGAYLDALNDISQSAPLTTFGAGNDFRALMVLRFYAPYLSPARRVVYVPLEHLTRLPPDWLLLESSEIHPDPVPRFGPYVVARVYPYGGFSGWTWVAYRRPMRASSPP